MAFILWLIAVALFVYGVVKIFRDRDVLWGIGLIILACLVGPGGYSLFT